MPLTGTSKCTIVSVCRRPIYFSVTQGTAFPDAHPHMHCYGDDAFTVKTWLGQGLDPTALANSYLIEYVSVNSYATMILKHLTGSLGSNQQVLQQQGCLRVHGWHPDTWGLPFQLRFTTAPNLRQYDDTRCL